MGTNAMIARRGTKGWEARITYFDGDPQRLGHSLFQILKERYSGDPSVMLERLMASDWVIIDPEINIADLKKRKSFHLEKGEKVVDGLGISDRESAFDLILWSENEKLLIGDVEWIYAFEKEEKKMQVHMVETVEKDQNKERIAKLVATVDLSAGEPNWQDIECGEGLERCGHAVLVHAERLGIDPRNTSAQLSLRQLAGQEELTDWNAIGATYKGKLYKFTGNGSLGEDGDFYREALVGGVKSKLNLNWVGVKLIYPKLRDELLRSGEMKVWPWDERTEIEVVL